MTLQNLSKTLDKYESQLGSSSIQQFELLKGLPYYDWRATIGQNHVQKYNSSAAESIQNRDQIVSSSEASSVKITLNKLASMRP